MTGWIIIVVGAFFILYQNRLLQRLSLFADEALANRIIEAERIKSAEVRLELYEHEDRHMCLRPSCRNPVAGKWIFAHCEQHLEPYEQQWLDEKLESPDRHTPSEDASEHPTVTLLKKTIADQRAERVQQNASSKMQALTEARNLLAHANAQRLERLGYLPGKLQGRIEREEKEQQRGVGGSWIPLNLVEWIDQEAEKEQ